MMNFTAPNLRISARTMDLGSNTNWTITSWPAGGEYFSEHEDDRFSFRWTAKYNTVGITGNWFGDDRYEFPSLFGDGINEKGLSCGLLTLVGSRKFMYPILVLHLFYDMPLLLPYNRSCETDMSILMERLPCWMRVCACRVRATQHSIQEHLLRHLLPVGYAVLRGRAGGGGGSPDDSHLGPPPAGRALRHEGRSRHESGGRDDWGSQTGGLRRGGGRQEGVA